MDQIKFGIFTFMENPETFQIKAVREPKYTVNDQNDYTYTGLGPLCRIITGTGVFRGDMAYETFNALQVLMATGKMRDLIHPIWGTMPCYLTELEMLNESREKYIAYRFTFREADEQGAIPPLPEGYEEQI